jgi:SAM-dependent methyltransferase
MAAVPVSNAVLDLGCGAGRHTEALLRLRFPVHACDPREVAVAATRDNIEELVGRETAETCVQVADLEALDFEEEMFNWVVADRAEIYAPDPESLIALLGQARRLLKPGGWVYLTVPQAGTGRDHFTKDRVEQARSETDLAEAEAPSTTDGDDGQRIQAIFRRVDPQTPA